MHKRNQLVKIEEIYGLVKEHGCENCGEKGHSSWACPLKMSFGKKINKLFIFVFIINGIFNYRITT